MEKMVSYCHPFSMRISLMQEMLLFAGLAIYADGTREEKKSITSSHDSISKGESFGGHHDTMPLGPRSVGLDFAFPCASHVYGIPEHSTSLSLPTTSTGSAGTHPHFSQPYRLYNLDVFEYELQETMALYGNIPLMWSHGKCANSERSTTAVSKDRKFLHFCPFIFFTHYHLLLGCILV